MWRTLKLNYSWIVGYCIYFCVSFLWLKSLERTVFVTRPTKIWSGLFRYHHELLHCVLFYSIPNMKYLEFNSIKNHEKMWITDMGDVKTTRESHNCAPQTVKKFDVIIINKSWRSCGFHRLYFAIRPYQQPLAVGSFDCIQSPWRTVYVQQTNV